MADAFDVFISYAHADTDWVRVLAENLRQQGLQVFFDEWEIGPGDVLVHRLDKGILNSRNGVLVVSPDSLSRPWVAQEYAAMITHAVAAKQRLIPVLLKDAELPPLLASRVYVDFRQVDGPLYDQRLKELVAALKGEQRGPPPRTGELQPPPGTGFRAEDEVHLAVSAPRFVKPDSGFVARFAAYVLEREAEVRQKIEAADRGRSEFILQPETCRWKLGAPIRVRVIRDCFTAVPAEHSL
jgi:hypothetical protein